MSSPLRPQRAVRAAAAVGSLALCASAQSPNYVFAGDAVDDWMGSAVAGAGDVDGDGRPDLIAGAPGADTGGTDAGLARVWSGADGTALLTIAGDSPFDQFGIAVAGAGDVNGDGRDDVLVGAWLDDPAGTNSGSARLVSGADGSTLLTFSGPAAHAHLGHAVAGAGDVDLDGVPDIAVGAPGNDATGLNSGSAFLYSGASGAPIRVYHGNAAGDGFGRALAQLGDLDGDGRPELAIGAPLANGSAADAGLVRVHSGASGSLWFEVKGPSVGAMLGQSIDSTGDTSGDGLDDLVASAHGKGEVRILSGIDGSLLRVVGGAATFEPSVAGVGDADGDGVPDIVISSAFPYAFTLLSGATGAPLHEVVAPIYADSANQALAGVGDVDGDGSPDIAAGRPVSFPSSKSGVVPPPGAGYVLVYAAPPPCAPVLYAFQGSSITDGIGYSVGASDLDGDGFGDIFLGAPYHEIASPLGIGNVHVRSGADGEALLTVTSAFSGDGFGLAIAALDDIGSDGVPDVAVGARYADSGASDAGRVDVYSGATGALAYSIAGSSPIGWFGDSLAAIGDVDGDSRTDFVVGAPRQAPFGSPTGQALVYSGALGTPLHSFVGDHADARFGSSVAGPGDVDLDGVPDILVGAEALDGAFENGGLARLYSGANGAVLFDGVGDSYWAELGIAVGGAGDVDADGVPDLIAGGLATYQGSMGTVRVWSGATGTLLHTLHGDTWLSNFGASVGPAGDADGDGFDDYFVGAPYLGLDDSDEGRLLWYSGRTGQVLRACVGPESKSFFGAAAAMAGDLDGDGVAEMIVGTPGISYPPSLSRAYVLSGALASLIGTPLAIPALSGANQSLALDAGPDQGGKPYLLLGTTSGTHPGIAAGALLLPLNPDGYFLYTLGNPNHPPLAGSLGLLDVTSGKASASFTLPAGVGASLAGLDVHHAFAVLDAGGVAFTSNAAALFLK